MLRHAMIILAIVLVLENSGLSTVHLPAAVIAAEITVARQSLWRLLR
jgi:hypothetical protein